MVLDPSDPQNLRDTLWWYTALEVDRARKQSTGEGVQIALIDSYVNTDLPELLGQDISTKENCRGYDSKKSTLPQAEHGTGMASLLVGTGKGDAAGGLGTKGVAPDATVFVYPHTPVPDWEGDGLCFEGQLAYLIDEAVADGADIINASWYAGTPRDIRAATKRALEAGVVVVAAGPTTAESGETFPAQVPGVVSVAAIDYNAKVAKFNVASEASVVAAPGVNISGPGYFPDNGGWNSVGWSTGVSDATAIVSGVMALVKAKYPDATGNQLVQHLIHTTTEDKYAWHPSYGFGIPDVLKLLASSPTQWPDENPLVNGPEQAVEDYPMWVSSEVEDPPGKGENAPEEPDSKQPEEQESGSSSSGSDDSNPGTPAASPAQDSDVAAWMWPLGIGALVVAAGVGALMTRNRHRGPKTAQTNTAQTN